MIRHTIDSTYKQFYVADAGLEPLAPENWDDEHIRNKHNTLRNITALCPEGDITARLYISLGQCSDEMFSNPEFVVETSIAIETKSVGVYGWPFELLDKFVVPNGRVLIKFLGFNIDGVDDEEDYYLVILHPEPMNDGNDA